MKKEQVFSPEINRSKHCLLHGSINRSFSEMVEAYQTFKQNGITVELDLSREISSKNDNFAKFKGEEDLDNYSIEGKFLQNLNKNDLNFCYFVNPKGYMGKGVTFELGCAIFSNIPVFFLEKPDLDFYKAPQNSIWHPKDLTNYINKNKKLPDQSIESKEWQDLIIPRSVVAIGAILEWQSKRSPESQVFLVQTHKWGNRFSIVGEQVERRETVQETLIRGVREETALKIDSYIQLNTFDQIDNSGYHLLNFPKMIFIDHIVSVKSQRVTLNDEAQYGVWMPVNQALRDLNIEPNARFILEKYKQTKTSNL
jgi:ADP-ribose pyrophosphatase YjhB (NUDIX family)